jgi:hypothetical protein
MRVIPRDLQTSQNPSSVVTCISQLSSCHLQLVSQRYGAPGVDLLYALAFLFAPPVLK